MTSSQPLPRVVVHPQVPEEERRVILAARPDRLKFTTDTPPPAAPSRARAWLRERRLPPREEIRRADVLARQHGRYVPPRELVLEVRPLLARAQQAIDTIRQTRVHRLGVLDRERHRAALPFHEWEIGQALAQYSRTAREQYAIAPQSRDAADAVDRGEARLAGTLSGVEARVSALESYAAKAREADALYAALATREAVARIDDALLDLTARSVADEIAVTDIASMDHAAAATIEQLRGALDADARRMGR
ncbi:hypothetical protein ACFYXM_11240 [Streptomyces sp. NPDC002476]|uniref:hypothetical protein n=1 Tax=Streptomyces sp. NPDC002476 TaxID=3364648 RepID=UPI0036CFA00E